VNVVAHRLEGALTIVAGVGGIGSAVARTFASEGARVWCLDLDAPAVAAVVRSIVAAGGAADGVACDSTRQAEIADAIGAGFAWLGGLDAFVTTVGGGSVPVPFLDLEFADWQATIERNLTAVFLSAQIAARHMAPSGRGSIVVTSSQLGSVAMAGLAPYCAAKGALNQLVKVMANDLAPFGLRVNALAPGPTWTPEAEHAATLGGPHVATIEHVNNLIPLGRWGRPDEIAQAAVFLASDESSFVTGTTLLVDGGYTSV
jgi:NAD(P)-dependent dehydrogenase (short-subunit alcohol dehydrogenase family)